MTQRGDALGAICLHGAVMQCIRISSVDSTRPGCKNGLAGASPARYAASNEAVSDGSLERELLYGPYVHHSGLRDRYSAAKRTPLAAMSHDD